LPDEVRRSILGPGAPFELRLELVLDQELMVFANRPNSVVDLIRNAVTYGERPALIGPTGEITFEQLPDTVAKVAGRLREMGVRPGDRVALCAATSVESILVSLATTWLGAIVVAFNPHWADAELASALKISQPTVVVVDAADRVRPPFAERTTVDVTSACEPTGDAAPAAAIVEDDPFAIVFTSGTTGRAKGATLSHRSGIHFCQSSAASALVRGLATGVSPVRAERPAVINSAPLFHVSGLLGQVLTAVTWGTTQVVPPPGRWDVATHLALSERHQVTSWSLVPTQLSRILEHPDLERFDLSSLSTIGGGGAAFAPALLRLAGERLPHVDAGMRIGYGMTEAAGVVTMLQPPVSDEVIGSVGPPVAGAEVQIRDVDGATPLQHGEVGMIWVRSASVFLGYWDDPAATAACLDDDRWYATGDFGRVEHGVLWLESRLRDMIIRGGENIYPIEIENRLVEHPEITDAAVVGDDDHDLGQIVRAVVVRRAGSTLDEQAVRDWVGEALASYKVPSVVEFRAQLPTSDTGKVLKREL
jgi:acyl-CoA synthetase (AMP-forming)/AMP-acid ligase II